MLEGRHPETMLRDLGKLVSEGWETKRQLSTAVTLPQIDATYDAAMRLRRLWRRTLPQQAAAGPYNGAWWRGAKIMTLGQKSFVEISLEDHGAGIIGGLILKIFVVGCCDRLHRNRVRMTKRALITGITGSGRLTSPGLPSPAYRLGNPRHASLAESSG